MADKYYAEIFNHSGASYHRAMELCPKARDEEFNAAFSLLQLNSGDRLLDVPAGGAYLKQFLGDDIDYHGFDFSNGFVSNLEIKECSETQIPIEANSIDKVICLAAMHHVQDKKGFVSELYRCLVSGGLLLIADVIANSKEAIFLNGFVDHWNSLGHDGDFINFERDSALLKELGFKTQSMTKHYLWNFESEDKCYEYLRLLFSLDKQPSAPELTKAVGQLGVSEANSGFHLNWSLGFIVAYKST